MNNDSMSKNDYKDHELFAELEKLQNEYNQVNSKKNVYINRAEILKDIFISVSNRLEIDPFITDKMNIKKKKNEEGCCLLY